MEIRIESSSSYGNKKTGVGYYTSRLTESLSNIQRVEVSESQFDFLGRQLPQNIGVEKINFPQKLYAKLDYFGVAPPFDLTLPPTDVTIFPNYALWPTVRSKLQVVTVHDLTYEKYPDVVEEKNLAYLRKIVPRSVSRADLILTVSESVKNDIVDKFGIDEQKVHVTPIPPTNEYFVDSDRPVRSTYGIPTKEYILFASTIEPRKNLDILLDAYASLPAELQNKLSLVVAGGRGWKSDKVHEKLISLQKEYPNIVTTGYYDQHDAPALFQQASIFVMPSLYEGFGMPLLEAMASQTPTIASDIPVFREVCGDASLFFDPKDHLALAGHISLVINDSKLSESLVSKGTNNLARYTWDSVSRNLIKKFEEML